MPDLGHLPKDDGNDTFCHFWQVLEIPPLGSKVNLRNIQEILDHPCRRVSKERFNSEGPAHKLPELTTFRP